MHKCNKKFIEDHQSHSCRADMNPYRHDGRVDKHTYRHDGRAYNLSQKNYKIIMFGHNLCMYRSTKKGYGYSTIPQVSKATDTVL